MPGSNSPFATFVLPKDDTTGIEWFGSQPLIFEKELVFSCAALFPPSLGIRSRGMSDYDLSQLHSICQRWSHKLRPKNFKNDVPIKRLPRPSYDGINSYNGFTGAERRRGMQVVQVLMKNGVIERPKECDICGKTERVNFHGEDYFDPFSMARLCFPCHMALHRRFKSPDKWHELLFRNSDSPNIDTYRKLPLIEPDFAAWLRKNTDGPHDPVARIWPDRDIPDYQPRAQS